MFGNAKVLDNKAKAPSKRNEKDLIEIKGLEEFAYADALEKNIKTWKKTLEGPVKSVALTSFLARANGSRPTNFRGVEGNAEASIELRKRGSNSPLNENEVEILTDKEVPFGEVVDVTGTYVINPEALEWLGKNSEKVEKALATIKGLPKDFILKQEAVVRTVVTDDSIEAAFKSHDEDAINIVTVLAIKPTIKSGSLKAAFELAAKLFGKQEGKVKEDLKRSLGK
jgi:hypothetical protein